MNTTTVLCGSHIPVLNKLMQFVDKPVLELGMGWNSTPLLHWICKDKELKLYSFESDTEWLVKFMDFMDDTHQVSYHDFETPVKLEDHFGLVFIDHRPARKRIASAKAYSQKADYVVLHDSELANEPAYKYYKIYNLYKYRYEYKKAGKPYTVVLSNFKDLSWLEKH